MNSVRDHVTERISTARVKLELKRARGPVIIVALGSAIALVSAIYVLSKNGKYSYSSTRQVDFAISDATAVISGGRQQVDFKGIPAGVLSGVKLVNGHPVLTATIYSKFGRIYQNAKADLRPATALDNMYLDITSRGTPSAGLATTQSPVPAANTQVGVNVADVLDAFSPDVRSRLGTILSQLGDGLSGQGQALRYAFVQIVPFLQLAQRVSSQLALHGALTRHLVHDTSVLTGALADRQNELRSFVDNTDTTLQTLAAHAPNLSATLERLPSAVAALDSSFAALRGVIPNTDTAVKSLIPAAKELPAGLTAIRNLTKSANPALVALHEPVDALVPLATNLQPLANNLQQAIAQLSPQVPTVNHVTSSVAGCAVALQGFFQWTPSLFKFGDAHGTPIRGDLVVGLDSSGALKDSNSTPQPSCAPGTAGGGTPGP